MKEGTASGPVALWLSDSSKACGQVPRFAGKTRITRKTPKSPGRPKNNGKLNMISTKFMLRNVLVNLFGRKHFVCLLPI